MHAQHRRGREQGMAVRMSAMRPQECLQSLQAVCKRRQKGGRVALAQGMHGMNNAGLRFAAHKALEEHVRIIAVMAVVVVLAGCSAPQPARFSGWVEAEDRLIGALQAGRIARVAVQEGAHVQQGALLFALDATGLVRELEALQARLAAARKEHEALAAELALARREARRTKALAKQSAAAQAALDRAHARAKALAARLAAQTARIHALQAQEQALRWRLAEMQVRAPVAGEIVEVLHHAGEVVRPGEPVVRLRPVGARKVIAFLPARLTKKLRTGMRLRVVMPGATPERLTLPVHFIATRPEFTPPVLYDERHREKLLFRVELGPVPAKVSWPVGMPVGVQWPPLP